MVWVYIHWSTRAVVQTGVGPLKLRILEVRVKQGMRHRSEMRSYPTGIALLEAFLLELAVFKRYQYTDLTLHLYTDLLYRDTQVVSSLLLHLKIPQRYVAPY